MRLVARRVGDPFKKSPALRGLFVFLYKNVTPKEKPVTDTIIQYPLNLVKKFLTLNKKTADKFTCGFYYGNINYLSAAAIAASVASMIARAV